jgi:hypothetical protein
MLLNIISRKKLQIKEKVLPLLQPEVKHGK